MSHDLVARCFLVGQSQAPEIVFDVDQGVAAHAEQVMVIASVDIVAQPALAQSLDLGQLVQGDQFAQRVIDRRAGDLRHHRQHALVDLVRCRVAVILPEDFQDDPPLWCDPESVLTKL